MENIDIQTQTEVEMMKLLMLLYLLSFSGVRNPAVSNMFYPGDPVILRDSVSRLLEAAPEIEVPGHIIGLIAPHAGYRYSGPVAATSFKQVSGKHYDLVVILGVAHRYPLRTVSVAPFTAYRTPLGTILIDTAIARRLIEAGVADSVRAAHLQEHSIEVELPFLQVALKGKFKILPIIVGYMGDICRYRDFARGLANALRGRNYLIVMSTDLSHYHDLVTCERIDKATIDAIASMDPVELYQGYFQKKYELCGIFPVTAGLFLAHEVGASGIKFLKYGNSAAATGDSSRVVGYSAFAIYRNELLNESEKQFLLRVAREAIEAHLEGRKLPDYKVTDPRLLEHRGVFVTITENGMLRGCIGRHVSNEPLWRTVQEMAIAAAFEDPRFRPLSADELKKIKIAISVYTMRPRPIKSYRDYIPGLHGIILEKDGHHATYLPEVPIEQCWTREETLSHLAVKAGLPPDAWKHGASFMVYTTFKFSE